MSWQLNPGEIISGLGAAIAFFAMIVTLWFGRRNLNLQIAATELKYFEDFQKWADQLADALTEAEHLCDLDPKQVAGESFFDRRHRLQITISSMVDRGRWFLPNTVVDDHGADKELGYRGTGTSCLTALSMPTIAFRDLIARIGRATNPFATI